MPLWNRLPTDEEIARPEAVRTAALNAAIAWFRYVKGEECPETVPRQVIVETARRFETYILTGE